jgi:hypothetical protein
MTATKTSDEYYPFSLKELTEKEKLERGKTRKN